MRKYLLLLVSIVIISSQTSKALNVTIIASAPYTMDVDWQAICVSMGHTATIYPWTELDLIGNLSSTDILIVSSGVDVSLTAPRISVIQQYLQNGGKVYLQSEYDSTFSGDVAYRTIVNALGGTFKWTGQVAGTLAPMNILGSITTDYAVTSPLPYFWYGQSIDPCSSVEMFLQYQGNYFGSIFCVPSSSGRVITASDQDWVQQSGLYPASDSLMKNIISNLAKSSYNCVNAGGTISVKLGNDTTLCNGQSIVLNAGNGFKSYLWQGGQTASSITADTTGTYMVTVTSQCGSTASASLNIIVTPCNLPVAALLSSDSSFCANSCINYTDLSTNNPTSWQWIFQGAMPSSSTDQNPQNICYTNGGTFNVTLIAANANGSGTIIYTNFISVFDAPPTPTITLSDDTLLCSFDSSYSAYQWYDDTTLVTGATNPYFVFSHNGNYNVQVTSKNGCSIAVGINITGVKQLMDYGLQCTIYPNPAFTELIIKNEELKIEKIIICNVPGEILRTEQGDLEKEVVVNVSDISSGIYFVNIVTKTEVLTVKFIKK